MNRNLAFRKSQFFQGVSAAQRLRAGSQMLKIQRSIDADNVRFELSGNLEHQQLAELQRLIDEEVPNNVVTLDLEQIRLVDREAVGFLARCEAAGIRLEN